MSVRDQHNMACPSCGDDDELHVVFTGECELFPDGTEDAGDHEWDGKSPCRCGLCDWTGTVAEAEAVVTAERAWPDGVEIDDTGVAYRVHLVNCPDPGETFPTYIEAVRAAARIG